MIMNIGIILSKFDANQRAFSAINSINSIVNKSDHQFTLFYKENGPICCKVATSCVPFDRMYNFDGGLISTDLDTTLFMMRTYRPSVRVLYAFELDWVFGHDNFLSNSSLLNNKELIVIAPSMEYAESIKNYSGRVCNAVVPSFHIPSIMKVIENEVRVRKQK